MIKASNSIYQVCYPNTNHITPIRNCEIDYFDRSHDKHPLRNPYSNSLWDTFEGNKNALKDIHRRATKRTRNDLESDIFSNDGHKPSHLNLDLEPRQGTFKRVDSPLDLNKFKDYVTLESPKVDIRLVNLLRIFENLIHSEEQYSQKLDTSNLVYRHELNENKKFKNNFFRKDSNDELLLFGNIDTISTLSKLFTSNLEATLSNCAKICYSNDFWRLLKANPDLAKETFHNLDIAEVFKCHFERIKSTYMNYVVSYEKQLHFLDHLKHNMPSLFFRWYEKCLEKSNLWKLEDIIKLPLERLSTWGAFIEDFIIYSDGYVLDKARFYMVQFRGEYNSFLKKLNLSIKEYNMNSKYDITLTPSEIIGFYEKDSVTCLNKQSIDYQLPKTLNAESCISTSSSRYSNISDAIEFEKQHLAKLTEDTKLADWIKRFRNAHKLLTELEEAFEKYDLTGILDKHLINARAWSNLIEFEPLNMFFRNECNVSSICSTYIDKINQQKQDVIALKVSEFRKGILTPLNIMIERCSSVKGKITNFKVLKREYALYLKDNYTHDIKREVITQSFENLQSELLEELPRFMDLLHNIIELILSKYIHVSLNYMSILAGGKNFLDKELELLKTGDRELGDNFDILQMFSSFRYHTKQAVREHWEYKSNPISSRVIRKLFEL